MKPLERNLLFATVLVLVAGAGAWAFGALRPPTPTPAPVPDVPGVTTPAPSTDGVRSAGGRPRSGAVGAGGSTSDDGGSTPRLAPGGGGHGIAGLRKPSGEDLSDPAVVAAYLRDLLRSEDPDFGAVRDMLRVLAPPVPADVLLALEQELLKGNAAGAVQAYEALRDGSVVSTLLRHLDDPEMSAHDRQNVLFAISSLSGGDPREVVTGIESRLDGDFDHDRAYLQAIARRGGPEAARALSQAILASPTPGKFGPEIWQGFDASRDPESAAVLAAALRDPNARLVETTRALAGLAGRPGAGADVVSALVALDDPTRPEPVRRQAFESLAATGAAAAIDHLLEVAGKGADFASVAARAVGEISSAPPESRTKLLDAARTTTDDNLRAHLLTALGRLKEPSAVDLATDYARQGSPPVRRAAVEALGRIGGPASGSVPVLSEAYRTGDEGLRTVVAHALYGIRTKEARSVLEQMAVSESSPKVKRVIQVVLSQFPPGSPP